MPLAAPAPAGIDPAWIVALVALGTALLGVLSWGARRMWHITTRTMRFMDDYFGEPESPGRAERPGVMVRLGRLEKMVGDISTEVHLNSGHSLRDTVQSTERQVGEIRAQIDRLTGRMEGQAK